MVLTLAGRELRGGFVTPLIWVLLGGAQIVLAWIFLQTVERFAGLGADERAASLTVELALNLFGFAGVVALVAAPLLAMRMLSGEFRDGSFELLGSAPVPLGSVVLGKLLGLAVLMLPLAVLPALNCLLLAGVASLDWGQLAAATLGLWLAGVFFCSVGLFTSSLTSQPGAAVLAAFGILLGFSVVGRAEDFSAQGLSLFGWLAWNEHLFWFLLGAVRVSDLAYFVLFTAFFAALAHRRLLNRRLARG